MTNEQTAIMLSSILTNLQKAIISAEDGLIGADVERDTEERYIGKPLPLYCGIEINKNPDDYETIETVPICLDDIKSVAASINVSLRLLVPDFLL